MRSSTSVEKTVEMKEALAAVYRPKASRLAAVTATKAFNSRVRSSARGRTSEASATTGRTPNPIANAPAAHNPYTIIRCR